MVVGWRIEQWACTTPALEDFTSSLDIEPDAWTLSQRGETFRRLDRLEEALSDSERAITLTDDCESARELRVRIFRELGNLRSATSEARLLAGTHSDSYFAWSSFASWRCLRVMCLPQG